MAVLIFANGDLAEGPWIAPYLADATVLIAADGGAHHLQALGLRPDVLIGDLDSISPELQAELRAQGTRFINHERSKDETDLELALLFAAEHRREDLLVFGALGGRLDQTLANILLLAHPALEGRPVFIMEPYQRAWIMDHEGQIHGAPGDGVSLIPLSGDVLVAQTAGLAWPLRHEVLEFGPARGISNVMTAEVATVSLLAGRILCVHTSQAWLR